MERLSPYQLKIEYKPGRELVTSKALSRLYVESINVMEELDPNWVMLYLRDLATCYEGLNSTTIERLKMDKDKFVFHGGNMCQILEDGRC